MQRSTRSPQNRHNKSTHRKIQKFDKQIAELKAQMLDGSLTQHVYTKKYEKLVKEKYNLIDQAD